MKKTVNQLIDEFMDYLIIEKGTSENTRLAYNRDIIDYCDFLEEEMETVDFKLVKKDDIIYYLSTLYDQNLAASSVSRKLTSIKMFHKFLFLNEICTQNIASYITRPRVEQKLPDVLSLQEVDKLINSFSTDTTEGFRDRTMIELLYSAGLRVSELVNLDISDIHLKMGFIHTKGKGDKERIIPIGSRASTLLHEYINTYRKKLNKHYDPQTLFLTQKGFRITRYYVWNVLKKHAIMCNIQTNISPHKLRHSFATHLLMNEVDIRYIQELLGHSDISTTQIYTHVNLKKLNDVITKHHPRSKEVK